jgi:hypothetical protein
VLRIVFSLLVSQRGIVCSVQSLGLFFSLFFVLRAGVQTAPPEILVSLFFFSIPAAAAQCWPFPLRIFRASRWSICHSVFFSTVDFRFAYLGSSLGLSERRRCLRAFSDFSCRRQDALAYSACSIFSSAVTVSRTPCVLPFLLSPTRTA